MTLKIEERERKILHAVLLNGQETATAVGEQLGLTRHQIGRSLASLHKSGVAIPYTLINQFALGWMKIGVYFSLHPASAGRAKEIVNELLGYENIVSLIELFGPYQYFMSINVPNIHDYELFMGKICADIPDLKMDESVAIRHSLSLFKRKYLCPESKDTSHLTYTMDGKTADLDDLSLKVLNCIIQGQGHPNTTEIAETLGVSNTIVQRKIKSLEEKGIIVGYSYSLDPAKLGVYPYDLLIKISDRSPKFKKKFFAYCQKHPSIVGLTECIGNWQYEVRIEVPSPSEATLLSQEIYSLFKEHIHKIETVSICDEIQYMKTPLISTRNSA